MGLKYSFIVRNTQVYDVALLERQIREIAPGIEAIHIGGQALVLEFKEALTEAEKPLVKNLLVGHVPASFAWTEGDAQGEKVSCSDDVDRITRQRIGRLVGGDSPVHEQLKLQMMAWWAHDVALFPLDYGAAQKSRAVQIRDKMRTLFNKIENIRQEGADFKATKGW